MSHSPNNPYRDAHDGSAEQWECAEASKRDPAPPAAVSIPFQKSPIIETPAAQVSTSETSIPSVDKNGAAMIAEERLRQVSVEGWTPEHDSGHQLAEFMATDDWPMGLVDAEQAIQSQIEAEEGK